VATWTAIITSLCLVLMIEQMATERKVTPPVTSHFKIKRIHFCAIYHHPPSVSLKRNDVLSECVGGRSDDSEPVAAAVAVVKPSTTPLASSKAIAKQLSAVRAALQWSAPPAGTEIVCRSQQQTDIHNFISKPLYTTVARSPLLASRTVV
jgi:hypothetical protein